MTKKKARNPTGRKPRKAIARRTAPADSRPLPADRRRLDLERAYASAASVLDDIAELDRIRIAEGHDAVFDRHGDMRPRWLEHLECFAIALRECTGQLNPFSNSFPDLQGFGSHPAIAEVAYWLLNIEGAGQTRAQAELGVAPILDLLGIPEARSRRVSVAAARMGVLRRLLEDELEALRSPRTEPQPQATSGDGLELRRHWEQLNDVEQKLTHAGVRERALARGRHSIQDIVTAASVFPLCMNLNHDTGSVREAIKHLVAIGVYMRTEGQKANLRFVAPPEGYEPIPQQAPRTGTS